jgi:hypothetical protein
MITGQPGPDFRAGIWNWTYIWPIVICCGVGTPVWPGGENGIAACSLTFVTPPMKKLPWSSIVTGPPMNFLGVPCADAFVMSATAMTATNAIRFFMGGIVCAARRRGDE